MQRIATKVFYIILCFTLSFSCYALDDATKAVQQSYQAWCQAVSQANGHPEGIVKLYAPGAALLPTLSPDILINNNGGLNAYFTKLTANDEFTCTPQKLFTQVLGDVAVNYGTYVFSYTDAQHKKQSIPARFTFVYQKINGQWEIVNHHSSVLPS